MAISIVDAIVRSEAQYATFYGGNYDTYECLTAFRSCVSGLAEQPFLQPKNRDYELALIGYRFQFYPGPRAATTPDRPMSQTAMTRFAVTMTPSKPDMDGLRAFCADDRRWIYATDGRHAPKVEDAHCVDTTPLRREQ